MRPAFPHSPSASVHTQQRGTLEEAQVTDADRQSRFKDIASRQGAPSLLGSLCLGHEARK